MYRVSGTTDRTQEGGVTMTDRLRRALRRFDEWTLIAFNPTLPR